MPSNKKKRVHTIEKLGPYGKKLKAQKVHIFFKHFENIGDDLISISNIERILKKIYM